MGATAAAASTSTTKANSSGSTPTRSSARRPTARNPSTTSAAPSTAKAPAAPPSAAKNQPSPLTPPTTSTPHSTPCFPYDWKAFFTKRLKSLDPQPPLAGLAQGGWKLIYNATPNKQLESRSKVRKNIDLRFSLGLIIDNEGDDHAIVDVVPGSPADKAGIGPNMKLLGVNGRKFDEDLLKDALAATPKTGHIDLLLENATYFINAKLDYNGGPRYPHLERVADTKDELTNIITPRIKPAAEKK